MPKIYFPNLNSLRFIAAFLVIIHHVELIKFLLGVESYWKVPAINALGKLGVILFFVLSGFLITYLLLSEEEKTKTISIKDFYMRRILRIWPLYYLIVFLSFFVLSRFHIFDIPAWSAHFFEHFSWKLILFMLFLPNLAFILYPPIPCAFPAWSVGVEEQFYLLWPVLMKKIKHKEFLLYCIIIGYFLMRTYGFVFIKRYLLWNSTMDIVSAFFDNFSINSMAIGGLLAYYLFKNHFVLKYLFNRYFQFAVYGLTFYFLTHGTSISYFNFEIYSILFGIIILNLAANKNSILHLEYKWLHYLGSISYGLYLYHPLAILIAIKLLLFFSFSHWLPIYLLSFLLTILLAGLSYRFYEQYFIRKKIRFTKIPSGD